MDALIQQAFDQNILDPEYHNPRFVNCLPEFVETANISMPFALCRLSDYCSEDEIEYVRLIPQHIAHAQAGMVYVGTPGDEVPVMQRMMAIAGACLRNFIDARVFTSKEVINLSKKGGVDAQVLCIPYFYGSKKDSYLSPWEVADLHSVLISRHGTGQLTILSVADLDSLEMSMGEAVAYHVRTNFHQVKV